MKNKLFDTLLENALTILEGIEYVDYESIHDQSTRKVKIYTNTTPEKFAEIVKYFVNTKSTLGGIYDYKDDNIILFDRDAVNHNFVREHLYAKISLKLISFYVVPRISEDEEENSWYIYTSGWSSSMKGEKASKLLAKNKQFLKTIKLAGEMGYKYSYNRLNQNAVKVQT